MLASRIIWPLLVIGASAAVPREAEAQGNCSVDSIPAALQATGPVYRDCEVTTPATVKKDVRFRAPDGQEGCNIELIVEFVVDTSGLADTTSVSFKLSTSRSAAGEFLKGLRTWRFAPAVLNGQRVRQLVQVRREHIARKERSSFTVGPMSSGAPSPSPSSSKSKPCSQ